MPSPRISSIINYDLRHLIRTIVNSRTYQLSFNANEWNADDETNFSHALPRRLNAEQLFDGISIATGTKPFFKEAAAGFTAEELPGSEGRQGRIPGVVRPARPADKLRVRAPHAT